MKKDSEGIKAIIFLQATVGIVESEEDAKKGWNQMNETSKQITLDVFKAMSKSNQAKN